MRVIASGSRAPELSLSAREVIARRDIPNWGLHLMSEGARARIVIADDHILLAQACKGLLEPEFEVVAIVNNGRALVKMAQELRPDVIIVDVAMPQLNGLDAGEQVKRLLPETKLVFLTMSLDPEVAAEAFRRGASGYVVKNSAFEELLIAIRTGLSGQSYLFSDRHSGYS